MNRRKFINTVGLGLAASAISSNLIAIEHMSKKNTQDKNFNGHVFNELPYDFNALEPYIDSRTMEIHYDRHHRGYYNKFMAAGGDDKLSALSLDEIFMNMSDYSDAVRNSAGGYYNHNLFWENMSPAKSSPGKSLEEAIDKSFGSFKQFRDTFNKYASSLFGSGWTWLILGNDGKLYAGNTPNQDNPLMNISGLQGYPLLALDVWEHAYYLKYQNKRPDYIKAFWEVINWDKVSERFNSASKG